MNTKFTALTLAAATAFAFSPKPAVAGDKGLAVVGGLIGGLLIASAINDHHDTRTVYVSNRYSDGYWKSVSVNVWVPGYYVIVRGHHDHNYRRYIPGHYDLRHDRVWVAYDRYDRRADHNHYDRYDQDFGRGYGYDRGDGRNDSRHH